MKLNNWIIGFLTGLILSLGSIDKAVTFPSKSVDSFTQFQDVATLAKLTASQVEKLIFLDKNNSMGIEFKVIVPTYIPPGFQMDRLTIEDSRVHGPSYQIIYRNANNFCFSIKGASGEFGGGPTDSEIVEVDSPALGKVIVGYVKFSEVSNQSSIFLTEAPIKKGSQGYLFLSPAVPYLGSSGLKCRTITIQEAVKIVESLQYLNP